VWGVWTMQNKVETLGHLFGSLRRLADAAGVAPSLITNKNYGWRYTGEVPVKYSNAILRYAAAHKPEDNAEQFMLQVRGCLPDNVCQVCGRPFDVTVTG